MTSKQLAKLLRVDERIVDVFRDVLDSKGSEDLAREELIDN